jgi:hypothetical protein
MHELVPEPGAKYGDESKAIWDENSRPSPPITANDHGVGVTKQDTDTDTDRDRDRDTRPGVSGAAPHDADAGEGGVPGQVAGGDWGGGGGDGNGGDEAAAMQAAVERALSMCAQETSHWLLGLFCHFIRSLLTLLRTSGTRTRQVTRACLAWTRNVTWPCHGVTE